MARREQAFRQPPGMNDNLLRRFSSYVFTSMVKQLVNLERKLVLARINLCSEKIFCTSGYQIHSC